MEILIYIESKNYQKVSEKLLKDDAVSRISLAFKDAGNFDDSKTGYYCYISGPDEVCRHAISLLKSKEGEMEIELAKEVSGKEKQEVINKIKEEEERAIEGFGNILG